MDLADFLKEVQFGGATKFQDGLPSEILPLRLDAYILSMRLRNCLARKNVVYVADLFAYSPRELLKIPNFGKLCLEELTCVLAALCLGESSLDQSARKVLRELRGGDSRWPARSRSSGTDDLQNSLSNASRSRTEKSSARQSIYERMIRPSRDDETKLSNLLPVSAANEVLSNTSTSVRLSNCLRESNIVTIGDLSDWSVRDLYEIPNFGKKSFGELARRLETLTQRYADVEEGGEDETRSSAVREGPHDAATSLVECLNTYISALSDRQAAVLRGRLGFGAEYQTLAVLGASQNVTRERIRQIESKQIKNLRDRGQPLAVAAAVLANALSGREVPLPIDLLSRAAPYFAGSDREVIDLNRLVSKLIGVFTIVDVAGEQYLLGISEDDWDSLKLSIKQIVRDAARHRFRVTHLEDEIRLLAHAFGVVYMASVLLDEMLETIATTEVDGEQLVVGMRQGISELIMAVLLESDRPLHFSTIATAIEEGYGRKVGAIGVSSRLSSVDGAILMGRGIYGVEKHITLSEDEIEYIREFSESLILGSTSRQWHSVEIVDAMEASGDSPLEVDTFLVNFVLKSSRLLTYLGRHVWVGSDTVTKKKRIDVNDAIIAILKTRDGPLQLKDIRLLLKEKRGYGKFIQVRATREMVCIAPGTWGIIGRDIELPYRVDEFLDRLHDTLAKHGSGISPEEFKGMCETHDVKLSQVKPIVVASLATTDLRFAVTPAQVIYLCEWGGPRHTSLREHVQNYVDQCGDEEISYNDLKSYLHRRYSRMIVEDRLLAVLKEIGVIITSNQPHDPQAGE